MQRDSCEFKQVVDKVNKIQPTIFTEEFNKQAKTKQMKLNTQIWLRYEFGCILNAIVRVKIRILLHMCAYRKQFFLICTAEVLPVY